MTKNRRGHRPPPQSRVIPPGAQVLPDPRQQQAQAQAAIRQKVEGLAATIFSEAVAQSHLISDPSMTDDAWAEYCQVLSDRSIDASLVLGKNLWGIEGARQKQQAKPKRAPRVLTEENDTPPEGNGTGE